MRCEIKNYHDGDERIIKRFALFPKTTPNELRWLEWCYIQQRYSNNYADDGWHNIGFVNKEDYCS